MTSKAPTLTTSFVIARNELDIAACTEACGVEPTKVWRQQRPDLPGRADIPDTNWILELADQRLYSVSEAVDQILDIVWPQRASICRFVRESKAEISLDCVVRIDFDRPLYDLQPATMRRLADLECPFWFDIQDESTDDYPYE
jgi:hypothetical protein